MRLKQKYRESAADVPALETGIPPMPAEAGAAVESASAAAPATSHEDSSLIAPLQAQRDAEAANRLDTVDAAKEASVTLERDSEPDPADGVDDLDTTLAKTGLPPLAVHWLEANPEYLYDYDRNRRLQAMHHELVSEGFEGYSGPYFLEMDRRLNGHGAVPERTTEEIVERTRRRVERLNAIGPQLDNAANLTPEQVDELEDEIDAINAETTVDREYMEQRTAELERDVPKPSAVDRAIADARAHRPTPSANVEPAPRRVPVSAPPSRESLSWSGGQTTGRNSRITLSLQQKEHARVSGVTEEEYARGLMRLAEEKERGNYGGQP